MVEGQRGWSRVLGGDVMNGSAENEVVAVGAEAEIEFLFFFCDGCGQNVSIIECPHVPATI